MGWIRKRKERRLKRKGKLVDPVEEKVVEEPKKEKEAPKSQKKKFDNFKGGK